MRIRELVRPKILIALSNEETKFLEKHKQRIIHLEELEPRDSRIAENLIFKDVLYKINDKQAMVNEYGSLSNTKNSI